MGLEIIQDNLTLPSLLLELAALDDVDSFKLAVEKNGFQIDEVGIWYTRRVGSKTMSYEQRTPLMIAAQYGSVRVLDYIINSGNFDVNRVSGSDHVTALHCAVSGGSDLCSSVVLRLVSASANVNLLDASGNRACDLIPKLPKIPTKNKQLDTLLKSQDCDSISTSDSESDSSSKKEYSVSELPDINNGVYGSDEFRMYCFKIKPCSRAYTHDWTECPFAHPGENARRRDPAKFNYTCVPCPEFKKGSCKKGEDCEFAHGVFESWLHPAQYRTRLCKDETGCARKVCFFAHRKDELRPVYASTGSAMPDNGMNVSSPRGVGGTSAPPLSPSFAPPSPKNGASGGGGMMWQGKPTSFGGTPPPSLQLPGSRLRSSLSARDMEFERELLKVEHQLQQQHHHHHQNQMMSPRWSNNGRMSDMSPSNLENAFNSINISRNMSLPMSMSMSMSPQSVLDSPINIPRKMSPPSVLDSPKAVAMLNSRAAAFVQRSHSFIDRSGTMNGNNSSPMSTNLSDWGSPNGKLDWGMQGDELNKLRKSNSFGYRNNHTRATPPGFGEPDVTWVNSLVKDDPNAEFIGARSPNYGRGGGGQGNGVRVQDTCPPWEQFYKEHEVVV
ncbi:hypothetical protein RND81_10G144200 [Saponaria officinalis]|uniref:C3H1-type domain-containing protein n=1 Tax=Saponaria officinalis TaxID=3572 RepID=A0AAW1I2N8_SAPOF